MKRDLISEVMRKMGKKGGKAGGKKGGDHADDNPLKERRMHLTIWEHNGCQFCAKPHFI